MAENPNWIESEVFKAPWVRIRGRVSRSGEVTWSPAIRTFRGPQGQNDGRTDQPKGPGKPGTVPTHLTNEKVASMAPAAEMPSAVAGQDDGGYWVACETEKGHVLAKTAVRPRWFAQDQQVALFTARLPYHETTRKLVLGQGRRRLGELEVPASTPNFDLSAPVRAKDIDTQGILHLRWEPGAAAKKHPLTYFVRFTSDGQKYYRPGVNLTGTGFDLDLRSMPGGKKCRAEVLATNGYHTAVAATPEFELPVKPPRLLLGTLEGPMLFAQGFALEHGPILGEQIQWSVDGKPVKHGGSFDARTLRRGQHVVGVSATSVDGQVIAQDLGIYDGATGRLVDGGKRL